MERVEDLLRQMPLFAGFAPADLRSLINKSRLDAFAPQEEIIRFGQPGRFLVVILDGVAEVLITNENGERQRIALRGQGDFIGEISLLTGEPTMADVIALEKCELLRIPQETFSAYLAVNPDALRVMAKTITERLRRRAQDRSAQTRLEGAWRSAPDPYGLGLSTTAPMRVLSLDASSSRLAFSYFDTAHEARNLEGQVEGIDSENASLTYQTDGGTLRAYLGAVEHSQALAAILDLLTDRDTGVISDLDELDAVGHKIAHGGDRYSSAAIIDDQVLRHIEENAIFAPVLNPLSLSTIRDSLEHMPKVPQVAVFDTDFHHKMPIHAYLYGLPYEFFEEGRLRKYGFHGIAHQYAALQAAAHLRRDFRKLRIITCHLDEEASVCAIDHGRSVDTSTGLTPLDGLVTGTRCGDLDASVVLHLMREKGLSVDQADEILNKQSGLRGLSGISGDFRELEDAANRGDHRSIVAIQVFCYRIRKYIGAYISAIGGLDVLVFTGGIGEESAWVRSLACQGLSHAGILIDEVQNKAIPSRLSGTTDLSEQGAQVQVLVIPAREGRMIARETIRALGYQNVAEVRRQEKRGITVEVSAHHVHLSNPDIGVLFGPGYSLTPRSELSQPGQYACEETLNLIGPRGRVERVRILGPARSKTQIEIAMTEEFRLGLKAPIRASGDLNGSPGVVLEGPKGMLDITQGVICSARHIHMSPEDALSFGLKDRDICMVRIEGDRTLIFGDVLVRVDPDYRLAMHIDTDEANAANIRTGMLGYLVSVQDRR